MLVGIEEDVEVVDEAGEEEAAEGTGLATAIAPLAAKSTRSQQTSSIT